MTVRPKERTDDRSNDRTRVRRRGTPLALLVILLGVWACMRAFTWDSPLAYPSMAKASTQTDGLAGDHKGPVQSRSAGKMVGPQSIAYPPFQGHPQYGLYVQPGAYLYPRYQAPAYLPPAPRYYAALPSTVRSNILPLNTRPFSRRASAYDPSIAYAPNDTGLMHERFAPAWRLESGGGAAPRKRSGKRFLPNQQARPPFSTGSFSAQPSPANQASTNRWLLDVYGFYRQGSNALSITQGRQPVYGASQLAANLQWRARPSSSHDPRVYARAYHALVPGGESEVAAGLSVLPIGSVPVRFYGELRATHNPALSEQGITARTNLRPTAYVATEIPPQKLPLGLSLETYGAGGYVGGEAGTYFLDGQAALTRKMIQLGKPGSTSAVVSLGAGVWGGAQKGAERVDVGPTLRFDVDIANMPARVSVDYREQVAGSAEPESGVAATVSTRF